MCNFLQRQRVLFQFSQSQTQKERMASLHGWILRRRSNECLNHLYTRRLSIGRCHSLSITPGVVNGNDVLGEFLSQRMTNAIVRKMMLTRSDVRGIDAPSSYEVILDYVPPSIECAASLLVTHHSPANSNDCTASCRYTIACLQSSGPTL